MMAAILGIVLGIAIAKILLFLSRNGGDEVFEALLGPVVLGIVLYYLL